MNSLSRFVFFLGDFGITFGWDYDLRHLQRIHEGSFPQTHHFRRKPFRPSTTAPTTTTRDPNIEMVGSDSLGTSICTFMLSRFVGATAAKQTNVSKRFIISKLYPNVKLRVSTISRFSNVWLRNPSNASAQIVMG